MPFYITHCVHKTAKLLYHCFFGSMDKSGRISYNYLQPCMLTVQLSTLIASLQTSNWVQKCPL